MISAEGWLKGEWNAVVSYSIIKNRGEVIRARNVIS